jgi:NACHT domain
LYFIQAVVKFTPHPLRLRNPSPQVNLLSFAEETTMHPDIFDEFTKCFKTESYLRQCIVQLFVKMGLQSVDLTHGPAEYGKDIVFSAVGPLDERRLYACVVKNEPFDGQMASPRSARTIVNQIQTALDTQYTNAKGAEEMVESVYVMSPHAISQSALISVKQLLKRNFGQVQFFCGRDLFNLFSKYWPDFVLFDSIGLFSYLAALQKSVRQENLMELLVIRHNILSDALKPIARVYVPPRFKEVALSYTLLPLEGLEPDKAKDLRRNRRADEAGLFSSQSTRTVSDPATPAPTHQKASIFSDLLENIRGATSQKELNKFVKPFRALISRLQDMGSDQRSGAVLPSLKELVYAVEKRWQEKYAEYKENQLREQAAYVEQYKANLQKKAKTESREIVVNQRHLKKELERAGKVVRPEEDVRLDLELLKDFRPDISECIGLADDVMADLEKIVAKANELQSLCRSDGDASPDWDNIYSAYTQMKRFAAKAPHHITADPTGSLLPSVIEPKEALSSPVLITGPAGFGKTTFCKWHALEDAIASQDKRSPILPVYIQLHHCSHASITSLADILKHAPGIDRIQGDLPLDTIRLYLDGLDEVPSKQQQETIVTAIHAAIKEHPGLQAILTARDHIRGKWLASFTRLRLIELEEPQIDKLMSNWLEDEREVHNCKQQLRKSRSLAQLMKVPLLATLIIAVYRRQKALPATKVMLYELFVDLHCGGLDIVKNVQRECRYGAEDKLLLLMHLAYQFHLEHRVDGGDEFIRKAVGVALPSFKKQWELLRDEVIQDGLLVSEGHNLKFAHLSFQEFLAATFLRSSEERKAVTVLHWFYLGQEWWREVLIFYVGLAQLPADVDRFLAKGLAKASGKNQDSVSGKMNERFELLRQSIFERFPSYGA